MASEIERKFLLRNSDWRTEVIGTRALTQAYLMSETDRSLRVRIENDSRAMLGLKIGTSSLAREEYEYPIPLRDARAMLARASGIILRKTRNLVHFEGFLWEIDVYHDVYHGLEVAEVEMASLDDHPPLPHWVGLEVTNDRRYSNVMLATTDLSRDICHGLPSRSG